VVDIIDDERTGLLCDPNDPKDIAKKVMRLYGDDALRSAIVDAARKKVESDFNLDMMMERTISVYEEAFGKASILVIKMSAIGDVILSVPSLREIRKRYPRAEIKVLVGIGSREVLDACPYINGVIVCDFEGKHKGYRGIWALAKELQRERFDIVIDLQNNKKSHLLAYLSLAAQRYGYDNGKLSLLLNNRIKDDAPHLDPVEHQFRVLRLAGIKPSDKRLELWPSASDEAYADKLLADNWVKPGQGVVGINVRASARWSSKNWPISYISELCDRLAAERNTRVVITGAAGDSEYAEGLVRLSRSKPLVACGRTSIMELASLIKRFKVYLTPDSAPMHIASSVGTPFIAFFGPTAPERHLAQSGNATVLSGNREAKCPPCYSPVCKKRVFCMKKISVADVMQIVKRFLA
jgi:lipopolysaccharide heptosyltransferase II